MDHFREFKYLPDSNYTFIFSAGLSPSSLVHPYVSRHIFWILSRFNVNIPVIHHCSLFVIACILSQNHDRASILSSYCSMLNPIICDLASLLILKDLIFGWFGDKTHLIVIFLLYRILHGIELVSLFLFPSRQNCRLMLI